ncbi:hypothetical protein EYF80_049601 [Liparis tanakae]|uniref:Uncharacterized protein n=1 Tax=Liparis tanakae TaxID=230148 RepID=A0A4Z2FG96_9TELE|nr:hypothetical protein EYF80_049601 [Liparis tanakae]
MRPLLGRSPSGRQRSRPDRSNRDHPAESVRMRLGFDEDVNTVALSNASYRSLSSVTLRRSGNRLHVYVLGADPRRAERVAVFAVLYLMNALHCVHVADSLDYFQDLDQVLQSSLPFTQGSQPRGSQR